MCKQDKLWPGGLVTYEISTAFGEEIKATIRNALLQLQTKLDSCLRFNETNSGHRILVKRGLHSQDSRSFVGYSLLKSGVQELHLGSSHITSLGIGVIWHEFLHAVGLWHTQTRSDRDNYIKIIWDNVFS